jgi:hypothetical protein
MPFQRESGSRSDLNTARERYRQPRTGRSVALLAESATRQAAATRVARVGLPHSRGPTRTTCSTGTCRSLARHIADSIHRAPPQPSSRPSSLLRLQGHRVGHGRVGVPGPAHQAAHAARRGQGLRLRLSRRGGSVRRCSPSVNGLNARQSDPSIDLDCQSELARERTANGQ